VKVAVLGGGAWSGVLAAVAFARGHDVALWESDPAAALTLRREPRCARTALITRGLAEMGRLADRRGRR
jgi:glycerol-3-phosphate dehydrogenase